MIIRYATVKTVNGDEYTVRFIGEDKDSSTRYYRLAMYIPVVGDMVAMICDSKGKYLCMGKAV